MYCVKFLFGISLLICLKDSIVIWNWRIVKYFWHVHYTIAYQITQRRARSRRIDAKTISKGPRTITLYHKAISSALYLLILVADTLAWYLVQSHWDSVRLIELFEKQKEQKIKMIRQCFFFFEKTYFFLFLRKKKKNPTIQKTLKIMCHSNDTTR